MIKKHTRTVLIYVAGVLLIILGTAAGFVPFVPGIILVIVGIYIISLRSPWIKRRLDAFRLTHPKSDRAVLAFERAMFRVGEFFVRIFSFLKIFRINKN